MAEAPSKRSRQHRTDSREMWDEVDNGRSSREIRLDSQPREVGERDGRRNDRNDRDRERDRDRDRARDRDNHRRYRSRSRERRDRDWDRRDRRRDDRPRDAGRGRGRDGEDTGRRDRDREWDDKGVRRRDNREYRSRSPRRRSRSPRRDRYEEHAPSMSALPIRGDRESLSESLTPPIRPKAPAKGKISTNISAKPDRMDTDNEVAKVKDARPTIEEPNVIEDDEDIVVEDDAMAAMQAMMGFGGFGTTKQKKIPGNDVSAVRKEKKAEYRQYMNRQGGFNRPLSPTRD